MENKNNDILIQIKVKNAKGFDIIKAVYQNKETKEISVVEKIKEEKCELMDHLFGVVFEKDSDEFYNITKLYKIPHEGSVYYSKREKRLAVYQNK